MDYSALSRFSYGMYIVTSSDGTKHNAMLASVASQVSSNPEILSISITKANLTHDVIQSTKKFNISIATVDAGLSFLGSFGFNSGRDMDKLKDVKTVMGSNGIPKVTENCCAVFECEVCGEFDCGANTVFFAKITNTSILSAAKAMSLDYYQQSLNGTVSKNAPAYTARYVK